MEFVVVFCKNNNCADEVIRGAYICESYIYVGALVILKLPFNLPFCISWKVVPDKFNVDKNSKLV